MKSRRTEKLSDILKQNPPLFAGTTRSFAEAYPSISTLRVQITEHEIGRGGVRPPLVLSESTFRHAVDCTNEFCYGGGIEVGSIVSDMARQKATHIETTAYCKGFEGSTRGRRKYRDCMHFFDIIVDISYRVDSLGESSSA